MNRKSRKYKKLQFIRKKNSKRLHGLKGYEIVTMYGLPDVTVDELLARGYKISSALKNLR
jgi:hypothetical protein